MRAPLCIDLRFTTCGAGIPMEVRAALATFAAVSPFKTRRESHFQFAQRSR